MGRRIFALALVAALAAVSAVAVSAQSYTPLQHGHAGVWGDPERVGEGMTVSPTYQLGKPFAFFALFLIESGEQVNLYADGDLREAWIGSAVYELTLYDRPDINEPAAARGTGWVATIGQRLHWTIDAGEIQRSGELVQLVRTVAGITRCNSPPVGFGPHPPPVDVFWCVY